MKRRTSRLLSILLVLCMVLALLPGAAWAADILDSGDRRDIGSNVAWVLYSDGTLDISGDGIIENNIMAWGENGEGRAPWLYKGYEDVIKNVVIHSGITIIDWYTFSDCSNLTSVTLPTSVADINMGVFSGCGRLSDVYYSGTKAQWEQVDIDDVDYENVSLLNAVIHCSDGDIPPKGIIPSADKCGDYVTWSLDSDGTLTIQGMGDMWDYGYPVKTPPWWENTVTVKKFVIKEGVTSVGTGAIYSSGNYDGIISVTLPKSITAIHGSAFMDYPGVKDVYYAGTEAQWKQIYIDDWNDSLFNATMHYNSGSTTPAPASTPSGTSVTAGGKAVQWTDAEPFIDANDRTMVPLRAVADAMSLTVNWDTATREASFTDGSKTIIFPISSITARTGDGRTIQMDTAAVIVSDRTYAPIRYLAEFFGYTVDWDTATKTVIITK